MGRPIPVGRDRLGILGGPFAAAALSDTDAEYAIGTNDFAIEVIARMDHDPAAAGTAAFMRGIGGANTWVFHYNMGGGNDGKFQLFVGVSAFKIAPKEDFEGLLSHIMVFADRSDSAHFYLNGVSLGASSIAAAVGTNIDSTAFQMAGKTEGATRADLMSCGRLFVIDPAAFPTEAERDAIAMQRFLNPDAESPVMAARGAYATERRLDVDFVDMQYTDTSVTNAGTGGTLLIGGGLAWSAVRTVAEPVAVALSNKNWRTFDVTHEAAVTADLGGVSGAGICEIIFKDLKKVGSATDQLAEISAGAGDYIGLFAVAGVTIYPQIAHGGTTVNTYLKNPAFNSVNLGGVHVLHMYTNPEGSRQKILVNGQIHNWQGTVGALDLTGNIDIKFGDSSLWDGILAIRLWNAASGVSVPDTALRDRLMNPWDAPDTLAGCTLIGNWENRIDASILQGPASTLIKNQANPGTGDALISGGGTLGDSTVLAVPHV